MNQNVKREAGTDTPVVGVIVEVSSTAEGAAVTEGGLEVAVAVIRIMNVNLQTMKASMDHRKVIKAMVIDTANLLLIGVVAVGANPIEADILTSSVVIPLKRRLRHKNRYLAIFIIQHIKNKSDSNLADTAYVCT